MGNSSSSSSSAVSARCCRLVIGLAGVMCCRLHGGAAIPPPLPDQVYSHVARSFGGREVIRVQPDLQVIIDRVMGRFRCDDDGPDRRNRTKTVNCQWHKANALVHQAGYQAQDILTPKTFAGVSVPLLYYALHRDSLCRNAHPCSTRRKEDFLACWTGKFLYNRTSFAETDLTDLITELATNYVGNVSISGNTDTISAPVIFASDLLTPRGATLAAEKFPDLAALLVSKLFYGFPVGRSARMDTMISHDTRNSTTGGDPLPEMIIASLFDLDMEPGFTLSFQRLTAIMKKLNIGDTSDHAHHHEHDFHAARQRRYITREEYPPAAFNRTCFSLDVLRVAYDFVGKDVLNQHEFERLCPALIQQSYFEACEPGPIPIKASAAAITDAEKYGYGTVAVVIVSLISIVGILFIPLFKKNIYEYALQGFIALGVGTLSSDALLHLLPEALNLHSHGSHVNEAADEHGGVNDSLTLWRSVACLAAIYGFFLWEICLHSFIHHRSRRGKVGIAPTADDHSHNHHQHSHVPDPAAFLAARAKTSDCTKDIELHDSCSKNDAVDKTHPPVLVRRMELLWVRLAPLAWMILLGDSLHNFGDGLTIAAAFSIDISSGISTTIAIFCHEVPHELGDFAILLSTGMSFRKAMALNFLTAVACLGGFYIGIPIAQDEGTRQWIFAVAAGMFLYIALADMLPELKNGAKDVLTLVVQNLGLLTGFAIMFLIVMFEDSIKI